MRRPYKYGAHESADPAMVERLERIADRLTQIICAMSGHDWGSNGVCKVCELTHPQRYEPPRAPRRQDG